MTRRVLKLLTVFNQGSGAGAAEPEPSPLLTGLAAYWKMDEASGNRADALGVLTLTDANTVTSTTGKIGNAASFAAASSERLTHADTAALQLGNRDFTIAGWFRFTTLAFFGLVGKHTDATLREYALFLDNADNKIKWRIYDAAGAPAASAVAADAATTATWYFLVVWHDAAGDTVNLQINNGTPVSAATGGGVPTPDASMFQIGSLESGASSFLNGLADEIGVWHRVLTSDERTQLYNGGSANTHPFE